MQKGELFVIGSNSATIPLHKFPSEVKAYFKDECPEPVPCDPGNADTLEYEVLVSNTVRGGFVLVITWTVSSVREIKWQVSY